MAGDAGVLVTEVVLISKKSEANQYSWVYLDAGKFGGLIETLDESIKYPIYSEKKGPVQETILAGPTCDSMDILYEMKSTPFRPLLKRATASTFSPPERIRRHTPPSVSTAFLLLKRTFLKNKGSSLILT